MSEEITPSSTINEVLRLHPQLLKVFYLFNVDVCCEGNKSIEAAAQERGFQSDDLIGALRESLQVGSMPFAS